MTTENRFAPLRVRVCLLALATFIVSSLCAASAHAQTTALFFDSQPGDWVGGGVQRTDLPGNGATFQVSVGSDNTVTVSVDGPTFWWDLRFREPGGAPLQLGHHYGATRWPFYPGLLMDVSGSGRGCNRLTGRFWVRELVVSGTIVQKLAIDFEQHCEDGNAGLYGAIRYDSAVASLTPFDGAYPTYRLQITPTLNGAVTGAGLDCVGAGPVCAVDFPQPQQTVRITAIPDPDFYFSGWSGTCSGGVDGSLRLNAVEQCGTRFTAMNAVEPRLLMLNSQRGEVVGQGKRHILNSANAVWTEQISSSGGQLQAIYLTARSLGGDYSDPEVSIRFGAPTGLPLTPGTYQATRSSSQTTAALDVSISGGCSQTSGYFTLHEIQVTGNAITKLALDFEQHCSAAPTIPARPLVGSLRINSTVPPRMPLAVVVGTGGRVDLAPSSQICATNCIAPFEPATVVAMTPTASTGFQFAGWQGDSDCTDGVVTMIGPIACEAVFTSLLKADVVTPNSGSGTSQTFTLDFSSGAGGNDVATGWVWFTPTFGTSSANSCLMYYERSTSRFFLLNDAGTTWQSSLAGSGTLLQNSRCAIGTATSGATVTGDTLRVTVAVTFKGPASGTRKIFMYAANSAGSNSGWQERGSWTIPAAVITADTASPNSGGGTRQTFALTYSSSFGATDLTQGWVWFTQAFGQSSANSCLAYYDRTTHRVFLLNDAGTTWSSAAIGAQTTLQNSQCALSPSESSASTSSNVLAVNLTVTFHAAYAGTKQLWTYATNGAQTSGWQNKGTWTAQAPLVTSGAPTPDSGSGAAQLFALPYSSNLGATDIRKAWVWFNSTLASSAAGSCLVYYEQATNTLFLLNDAGTLWQPATIGTPATLENGQCAIAVGSSAVVLSGDVLTLQLSMTFKPAFAGSKNIYLFTEGNGSVSGWLDRGDWIVPAPPTPVSADSASPASGSGSSQVFALDYSSTSGAAALTTTWVWFTSTFSESAAGSCLAYYEPASTLVYLLNDAGTIWQSAPLGSVAPLQNSQCAIDPAASGAALDGNTLTLTLAVTFKPAFAGDKNIYLYAASGGLNSGWQDRGDWTVTTEVTADSATPGSGSGQSSTFDLAYSSVNGGTDVTTAWVWFNATFASSAAGSCLVYYDQTAGALFLLNDAGTTWQSAAIGSGETLQNAQCAVDVGGASATPSGNTLTVTLPVTFTPAFAGAKNIYMYGSNVEHNSGWQDRGDWTVP